MSGRVTLEVEGGVARLRLARPEAHNGIDPGMVDALGAAVAACDGRPDIRCLLIGAEGSSFSVGGDLRHLAGALDRLPEELERMIGDYHVTLARLAALPVPVVCGVRGAVAGGALGLLWCADVVIAAADLRLTSGFAQLGLSGDGGSTWHLPRLVGMRRALDFTLGGLVLSADEALDWGLVSRVVPVEVLEAAAEETARRFAAGPTVAYAHIRRLLRTSWSATFEEQLAAERAAIVDCGRAADAREGIAAFAARRTPHFEGR
jgi:2-(1,2-epoxy-1,2-dihydrophenyl)acetyl-CoA isomerase